MDADMNIYPPITLVLLNGFLLIIPLLILHFGLPTKFGKALKEKVDHFPPVKGIEKIASNVYFVSITFLTLSPILSRIRYIGFLSIAGWILYGIGLIVFIISINEFSKSGTGFTNTGIYRFSRNPMYIGYFMIFLGVAFLIGSWTYLIITFIYQIAIHFLILSEERWCVSKFGKEYLEYCEMVARYL